MSFLRSLARGLLFLFRRDQVDKELEEELHGFLDAVCFVRVCSSFGSSLSPLRRRSPRSNRTDPLSGLPSLRRS